MWISLLFVATVFAANTLVPELSVSYDTESSSSDSSSNDFSDWSSEQDDNMISLDADIAINRILSSNNYCLPAQKDKLLITDDIFLSVLSFLMQPQTATLDFSNLFLTEKQWQDLLTSINTANVKLVCLNGSNISDPLDLSLLIAKSVILEKIDLSFNEAFKIYHFVDLIHNLQDEQKAVLLEIDASNAGLDEADLERLTKRFPSFVTCLKKINLSGNNLGAYAAHQLEELLFSLGNTQILAPIPFINHVNRVRALFNSLLKESSQRGALQRKCVFKNSRTSVFQMTCEGVDYARKDISIAKNLKDIQKEISIQKLFNHPNILPLKWFNMTARQVQLYFPFAQHGSLYSILNSGRISMEAKIEILYQILLGLHEIHSKQIIHGDIKSLNILVDHRGKVMISDFGLSIQESQAHSKMIGYTDLWRAPEVYQERKFSYSADIWALGILCCELFVNTLPFGDKSAAAHFLSSPSFSVLPWVDKLPLNLEIKSFIKACLYSNPNDRLTASKLLEFSFLQNRAGEARLIAELNSLSNQKTFFIRK